MRKYSKAIAAFVGAAGSFLLTALPNGVDPTEWQKTVLLGVMAAVATWAAPKNADA